MTFRTIWSVLRRVPEFARLPFHSASSFRRNLQSEMEGQFCGTKLAFTTIQTLMVNANADAWLQKMKLVRWESVISATFPREGKGLVSLKFLNKWINDTERVHASVVIFTFNNLTQERQGSRLLGWKRQSRTSISKRAPPMFSGGSKVVKLLVPYLSESCTQKGSYEKNSIKFPSSEWNFPNFVTSSENYTSLLMHVVVHPLSLYGVPEQLPRGTLETPLDGTETAVPLHEHRRGRRDVGGQPLAGAKIRCSDDVSGVRWRNENKYLHGGSVGSVYLLHGSVLCTLPLSSGRVVISLGGYRRLATSIRAVCQSWSLSSPASLVSVP